MLCCVALPQGRNIVSIKHTLFYLRMMMNVSFYLILAFSILTVLPSYPSNGATIEPWLRPIRLTTICTVLTAAVCLSTGFSQQHPCNPLKDSEVSSTLMPFVLSVRACCSHIDLIFTSHVSHSRSVSQTLNETHTHIYTRNMMISKTCFSLQPFKAQWSLYIPPV